MAIECNLECCWRNDFSSSGVLAVLVELTFFLEQLTGRGGSSSGNSTGERLLSTLLTEMDGLEEAKVYES